jgi:Domain of unknown function (DUF4382)
MKSPRRWIAALAPTLLLACGQGTGRISVLLTDAPADFKAAVVTITRIDLVGSGGTTVLSDTKVTTNLLTLANDTALLVDSAVVAPGTYSELRFVITGGYVEVAQPDGSSIIYASSPDYEGLPEGAVVGGTLRMPSYAESGLKVHLGGLKVGTDSKIVLVDFDVSQSFGHVAGGSGAWVMHPVMTATELELSGTVNVTLKLGPGVTLPPPATLGQFGAVLTSSGGSAKTLTLTDAGGGVFGASFKFLLPGSYTLGFTAPGTLTFTTSPAVPASVTVASGQATAADFVLTSAH